MSEKANKDKKEYTFKCLQCGEKIIANVINISYEIMYTTIWIYNTTKKFHQLNVTIMQI